MKLAFIGALVLASACAHQPQTHQVNPAVSSQLVSSEPPRAMGETPATVQTTSAELESEQPKAAPAPHARRSPP